MFFPRAAVWTKGPFRFLTQNSAPHGANEGIIVKLLLFFKNIKTTSYKNANIF